jgi:PilZ domain
MSFTIRPYRRIPVHCFVKYNIGSFTGTGTVWNVSLSGCRFSGNVPMRPGEILSVEITLPNEQRIKISEAIVRWSRGKEFGIETIEVCKHTRNRLAHYVRRLTQAPLL